MPHSLTRRDRIQAILTKELTPIHLEIHDESAKHAHHQGVKDMGRTGETHFNIAITSAKFNGLNRIARHRLVNNLLADEFQTGLHALSLVLQGEEKV
ncbi:BolA family protein [Swingsia samuiensis]|uniref:BolA family transcriptional regulator n=1 Tax=Swingsia samuiensis TaxID=1293412 RepID=A0A4Y6UIH0_9PROT|nr:BolA family protein [Swingsia samuiensis]QDH16171.1 BolA family transcriptional regulator [Swingsia samuiensis]